MSWGRGLGSAVLPLAAGAAFALGGCGADHGRQAPRRAGVGGQGAQLFAQSGCGNCHTLSAAGTSGTVGPNLDVRNPTLQEAASAIANGRAGMPAYRGRLTEAQVQALAGYVTEATRP